MRRSSILIVAAALGILLGLPVAALDNEQAPDVSVGTCIEKGGTVEQPEGSAIRACCLDSDITGIRGCYICDYKWENCVWDPAKSKGPKGLKGGKPYDIPDDPELLSD
jgi:hypothetical protein